MPIELKPCPRCGREPAPFRFTFNLFDGEATIMHQYRCSRCGISGKVCGDLEEAAEEWNRRSDNATG